MRTTLHILAAFLLLTAAATLPAQSVTAIPKLDATRYTGTWYEIARIHTKHAKKCTGDAVEIIARSDKANSLDLVDACTMPKGFTEARNATARPQDKKLADGRLKIITFWPLSRKYWVLAVGADYEWSLVGSPNHKELWILSRKTTLAPEVLADITARAAAQGFNTGKLVPTPQTVR